MNAEKTPDSIRDLLLKVKALAHHGIEGEKISAQNLLKKLLQKHGLSLEDLVDSDLKWRQFKVATASEFKLLLQCYYMVLKRTKTQYKKSGRTISFELSIVDATDLASCFEHYKALYKTALNDFFQAFIYKNRIVGPTKSEESHQPLTPEEKEEIQRIIDMMNGIKNNRWQKPLGQLENSVCA